MQLLFILFLFPNHTSHLTQPTSMSLSINGNGVVPSGQPIVMQLQPSVVTPAGPAPAPQIPKTGSSEAQVCCLVFLNVSDQVT